MKKNIVFLIRNLVVLVLLFLAPIVLYGLIVFMSEAWEIIPNIYFRVAFELLGGVCFIHILTAPVYWMRDLWLSNENLPIYKTLSLLLWSANIICLLPLGYYRNIIKFYQFISSLG